MWNSSVSINKLENVLSTPRATRSRISIRAVARRHSYRIAASAATIVSLCLSVFFLLRANAGAAPLPQTLENKNPISYFIANGAGKPGYHSTDRELARWALDAWQRSASNEFRFAPSATESAALVRVYWAGPDSGEYGEMRPITVGSRQGAAVFIRPDIDSLGEGIAGRARADTLLRDSIVYLTCVHELGHALGLAHTRDFRDIMYFFGYGGDVVEYFGRYRDQIHTRADIARVSGLSEADKDRIRAIYGHQ